MRLLLAVLNLLRGWWRADRIRVSPNAGRLLRLGTGALLTIEGQAVEVLGRRLRRRPTGAIIAYDCLTPSGTARLFVKHSPDIAEPTAHWSEGTTVRPLHEADIIIWKAENT